MESDDTSSVRMVVKSAAYLTDNYVTLRLEVFDLMRTHKNPIICPMVGTGSELPHQEHAREFGWLVAIAWPPTRVTVCLHVCVFCM